MSRYYELLQKVEKRSDSLAPVPLRGSLEIPNRRAWASTGQDNNAPKRDLADWLRFWEVLLKHWRVSAGFAVGLMFLVVVFTLLVRPVYEPTARLEIDPPGAELFSLEQRGNGINDAEYLETQAKNLEGDELAVTVIRQLRLDRNPDLASTGVVSKAIGAVVGGVQRLPRLIWKQESTSTIADSPEAGLRLTPIENKVLRNFQQRLTVKRDTASRLVSVSFESHDPVLAADITNTIVHAFIERTYQTRHDAIMESTQWLSRQLDDIRAKMEQSNRALADFQQVTGIADLDQNRSTFTENMAELSRQRTQAQAERIQIGAYLSKIKTGNLESLPQIQASQVIQQLTQRLAESRAELSNTRAVYGPNHPNTKKLQNQVDELQVQIKLQQDAILAQLQTTYAAAASRENSLAAELRGSTREVNQIAQYAALKKEAEANAALYNNLYSRIKEAGITAASKSSNIRVVDKARVLDVPTRPKPLVNFGVGLLVALVGGVMLAFIREALDNRIHTAEELRDATGLTVSILPVAEELIRLHEAKGFSRFLPGRSHILHVGTPPKFVTDKPASVQAEAMRGLQTSIMLSHPQRPPRVLLVLSSLPGEGKTTVAVNLAISLAKEGRTCLVDADLRRPGIAHAFNLTNAVGVANYLANTAEIESTLLPAASVQNLTIMPAGTAASDPCSLISPERIRELIEKLRERYEYVVIDSPPILAYADGRAVAPFVDGVVLVGRAGIITRAEITRSVQLLEEVHAAPVLEIVLNAADISTPDYRYYHYRYN